MSKFKTHRDTGKASAIRQSFLNQRQNQGKKLMEKHEDLLKNSQINESQRQALQASRTEFGENMLELTLKEQELAEVYMQNEIDIIEDFAGKYTTPGIVDAHGQEIKSKPDAIQIKKTTDVDEDK